MLAQNRACRWYDLTMTAQRANAGPLTSSHLKTAERLDRPVIRTFQRHPGNQVSEAQMIAKVCKNLSFIYLNHKFLLITLGYNKSSTIS
jgi:hypothetical protein